MILRSSSLPTAGVPIWPSQLRLPCSFKRMLGDETPQFEAAHANASFTGVANDAPLRHILSFRSLGNAPVDAAHAYRSGYARAAGAILELAEAAERVWLHGTKSSTFAGF